MAKLSAAQQAVYDRLTDRWDLPYYIGGNPRTLESLEKMGLVESSTTMEPGGVAVIYYRRKHAAQPPERVAPAKGQREGVWVKVCIALDDETFAQVRSIAVEHESSFAAAVREVIELGLETMKECE